MYGLSEYKHAMYFFTLALDADKNDTTAMLGMAFALSDMEEYEKSVDYIMRTKKIEELSAEAWLLLAENYIELDRDDDAVKIFKWLAKQYPKDIDVWLEYSNYYAVVEDYPQACDVAKQGLAILPDNPFLLYRMANYYFLEGDIVLGSTYLYLAFHINAKLISFFAQYDEEVMKLPEVIRIINNEQ
jgi:tetratricopeptide (TPR) repeat protein